MIGLFKKFLPSSAAPAKPVSVAPSKQDAGKAQLEQDKQDYETFVAKFEIRQGQTLMKFLQTNNLSPLIQWLHWMSPHPEARAFVRTELAALKQGNPVWFQPVIGITVETGAPTVKSHQALEMLAQVLGKPIRLKYRPQPGADHKVLEFEPDGDIR